MKKPAPKTKKKTGPEPERLKLEGPWQDRIKDSFKAKPARSTKAGTKEK